MNGTGRDHHAVRAERTTGEPTAYIFQRIGVVGELPPVCGERIHFEVGRAFSRAAQDQMNLNVLLSPESFEQPEAVNRAAGASDRDHYPALQNPASPFCSEFGTNYTYL